VVLANSSRFVAECGAVKPHLLIMSDEGDPVLKGRCSACANVTFSLSGSTQSSLALIHEMFSEHFRNVHRHEDTSQAAASL
jgi:hypothetical protein